MLVYIQCANVPLQWVQRHTPITLCNLVTCKPIATVTTSYIHAIANAGSSAGGSISESISMASSALEVGFELGPRYSALAIIGSGVLLWKQSFLKTASHASEPSSSNVAWMLPLAQQLFRYSSHSGIPTKMAAVW